MESMYTPVILKALQVILSLIVTVPCFFLGNFFISIISCCTNIRFKFVEFESENWIPLRNELQRIMAYRSAEKCELREHNDVCAVCLAPMHSARVTPCNHFFHAECLRRSLAESAQRCPICKQDFPPFGNQKDQWAYERDVFIF